MSRQDEGGISLGGPVSVVDQLQLQIGALQTENVALRASIDALRREKEDWMKEKSAMSARLEQSARRLNGARVLKKQAKQDHSNALDELRLTTNNNTELMKAWLEQKQVLKDARGDLNAATDVLHDHMRQCPQNDENDLPMKRTRALRDALAYELANEAYTTNECDGRAKFVVPVCITIWASDSDMVAKNNKWREVRRNGKKIMQSWYRAAAHDTGACDQLDPEMEGWLNHAGDNVVLQRRRGV